MALQSSGAISLANIQSEFGGSNPISLSEYYRNGAYVTSNNTGVPTSGTIQLDDFYGASKAISMTYEIIGGGGEGGGGSYGGTGSAGGSSSFSGSGISTVTVSGGSGGVSSGYYTGQAGSASYYGSGGAGGLNSDSGNQSPGYPAPSSSYGAGGGGGGSAPFAAYNGGGGGGASTRQTGTILIAPSTLVTVTIGSGGSGIVGGGNGASGYAKFTVSGQTFTFTSSGTFTVP
jgi:hypothetical protein